MKAKKILSLVLSLLMLLSVFTACGTQAGEPNDTATAPASSAPAQSEGSSEPAKLSGDIIFWHSFTQGPRMETLQSAADAFMKQNPGVKITIETFSWSDFYTKWTTGLASGNVPDMSTAQPGHVSEMINAEAILPLDDLINSIGRERFYEAPLTEMTADGSTYAVPLYSHAQVMWYRKDLLQKYNLQVPTTWDELYEAASIINKGEGGAVFGCSVPMGTNDMMATRYLNFYVRSAGETLITKDGKANLTSQAAIDGINYWVKMYKNNSPSDSINYNVLDQATLYYQGKNAFDFNSAFHISGVEANRPDLMDYIDCAPMPTIKKGDAQTGYETSNIPMVIWKNSKHPEISKAFIEYLYQPENYVPFLLSVPVGMLPAIKEVVNDATFNSNATVQKFNNALNVISNAVGYGTAIGMEYGPRVEAGLITSQGVIESMFQDIILNGTDVQKAAKAAEDRLNELFEAAKE
jgi:multiple sugar transport system substrate-binding protein